MPDLEDGCFQFGFGCEGLEAERAGLGPDYCHLGESIFGGVDSQAFKFSNRYSLVLIVKARMESVVVLSVQLGKMLASQM